MADDSANDVSGDTLAVDRSARAAELQDSYAQDSAVQSGASPKTIGLLKEYVDIYLQQQGVELPPVSSDNSGLVAEIERELGLAGDDTVLGPLIAQDIEAFAAGQKAVSSTPSTRNVSTGADPIEMFSGQFQQDVTDLSIVGAGMNFAFRRVYKNQAVYFGPLGANWDHCYNLYIREWGINLIRSTGELREDLYTQHPLFGQAGFNYWVPPDGRHGVIEETGTSYQWRSPNGVRFVYQPDVSDPTFHRIARLEDRFGNYLSFTYSNANLARLDINHHARFVQFEYDTMDRIIVVRDHTGRKWTYEYYDYGDLVIVTSPSTDRYPLGLSTSYEYSSDAYSPPLQHNLLRIIDPAGQLYLENDYGGDPGLLNFNRVIRQRQGSSECFFAYQVVVDDFEFNYDDSEKPAIQVDQMLRNGQMVHFIYNRFGNMLLREEYLLQGGLENLVQWRYRYNRDGSLLGTITPEGCITQYYYGREDYLSVYSVTDDEVATDDNLTASLRMSFGNLLAVVRRATKYTFSTMDLSLGVWGDFFPDVLGATDPNDIVIKNTYEPDFQQLLTTSDPRFTRSADPRFAEAPAYNSHLIRYGYSALPLKILKRITYPDTTFPSPLPNGTTGLTSTSEEYLQYDARGRLLRVQDPEGNITESRYFQGGPTFVKDGYLKSVTTDVGGLALTSTFDYNDVGITTSITNPRGVETKFVVNALDQKVVTISGGPGFRMRSFYNKNGLLERQERDALDDQGNSLPDGPEVSTFKYDEQDNLLRETHGGQDLTQHHARRHRYDCADCRIETIFPEGNRVQFDYEERMLLHSTTRGAFSDLASTTKVLYDDDGRKIVFIDGRGNYTRYAYDTFSRITAMTDSLGNVQQSQYDKLGSVSITRFFERRSNGQYYLLRRSEFTYDERGSNIAQTDFRFDAPILTVNITQSPDLEFTTAQNQNAVTALVTQRFYDRNKRLFRQVNRRGQETNWEFDGVNRTAVERDNLSNYTRTFYDENSNVNRIDRHEVILDQTTLAPLGEEVFSILHEYDALDRRIATTDGLGNRTVTSYDSRNNPASVTDPLGNVRVWKHDIYNRRTFDIAEMTRTGIGGGARLPDIEVQSVYDDNDRLISLVDAKGNVTEFSYDDLDRKFQTTYMDGSTVKLSYDPDDHVVRRTDNNGLQMVSEIDPLGRCTRLDLDQTLLNPGFLYPQGAESFEAYEYDGLGQPLRQTNDFCGIKTKFDSLGRPYNESIAFATPYPGPAGAMVLERKFDESSNRTDITYPSGRLVRYVYDGLNRVQRVSNEAQGTGYPGSGAFPAQYDIAKYEFRGLRVSKATFGNQTTSEFSYDGASRLLSTRHSGPGGPFLEIQQAFDGVGNRRFQMESPASPGRPNGEAYSFDSLYRLTKFVRKNLVSINPSQFGPPNAPVASSALNGQQAINVIIGSLSQSAQNQTYRYDASGNRERERLPGQPPVVYSANSLNQYTAVGGTQFQYDLNGNLIDDGQFLYSYNYRNQLVRVRRRSTNIELLSLLYDSGGRPIAVRESGTTSFLVNDGLNVVEEYDATGLTNQYVYESGVDRRCQMASGGEEWWYHRDVLLTTRVLSDSSGQQLGTRYAYEPFGLLTTNPAGNNRYLFTGKRLFKTIDVYDSRARQYSASLGRFLQRDPKGLVDGPNAFAYAGNNPVTYLDILGTEKKQSQAADPSSEVLRQNVASELNQSIRGGAQITDPSGNELEGTYNLWSGGSKGQAQAAAAPGYVEADTAEGALARAKVEELIKQGKYPPAALDDPSLLSRQDFEEIWIKTSARLATKAALSNAPVTDVTPRIRGWVKTNHELPRVAGYGALSAGLSFLGAGIVAYQTSQMDDELLKTAAMIGASVETTGAGLYGFGDLVPSSALMSTGASMMRFGGGVGLTAVSSYFLAQDIRTGDVTRGVGDFAGTLTGALMLVGAGSAAAVTGAFAVGYGVGTLINTYAVEPLIDKAAPGSGALGDWYYRTFLK